MLSRCILVLCVALATTAFTQNSSELQVITMWPKGATEGVNQVGTVMATFNKPMVPLQQLPEGDGTGPLIITPALKGKYRWLGTSTVAFTPAKPFELATEYTIKIAAGTKALDGSTLAKEVRWSFSTPRPALVKTWPAHTATGIDVEGEILLQFSLPMDPTIAAKTISLMEGAPVGPTVPFTASTATHEMLRKRSMYLSDSSVVVLLKPFASLKKNQSYTVVVKKGTKASRGVLGTTRESSITFQTYGPFSFLGVDQPVNRNPNLPLSFQFSTPIAINELMRHLAITPSVESSGDYLQWTWSSGNPTLHFRFAAQTRYSGTISGNLRDVFGQKLGKDVQFSFNTVSFDPHLNMTTGHGIIEAYSERKYPVNLINMEELRVQMTRLTQETVVPMLRSDTIYARHQPLLMKWDVEKIWKPRVRRDVRATAGLDLSEGLGTAKTGALLLQVSASGNVQPELRSYFRADVQVTELGVSAKFSPEDILIWVTQLRDAKPLAGANVQVRDDSNRVRWQGVTNDEGIAESPGWRAFGEIPHSEWSPPRLWVIVARGEDLAYTASTWNDGIEPYRFNVMTDWNPQADPWGGVLFTERGIYRPGEDVEFKGIFRSRRKTDWQIPTGEILLRVYDPQSDERWRDSMRVNEFGSVAARFKIPHDARLGYYTVEASIRKARHEMDADEYPYRVVATASFRVEAYRVSEFEVTARISPESLVVGDGVRGSFSAKYLFGGALKNEKIRWRLRFDPSWFSPPGWEGYWFGRTLWSYGETSGPQPQLLVSNDTTLGPDGTLDVRYNTTVGSIRATGNLVLEADVTSPSRQVISGRASALVHQGAYYIGISPSSSFIKTNTPIIASIITVSHDGSKRSGEQLTFKILQRQWHSVRRASAQGGFEWTSQAVDTLLYRTQVTTADSAVRVSYTPQASGFYIIQVEGKDRRGNALASDAYFYASGSDYVAWERTNDDRIELVADRKQYKAGQTARIIIKNPYEEATALITVEREGILTHWRTAVKGSAPEIAVKLDGQSLPNVFVGVLLLQGRMTKRPELDQATDVGRPSFKIGYMMLPVDPGTRHLVVKATSDRENYRPGDSVTVLLNVLDAYGKPARSEVAVSVADKGVLNLIGYRLPDAFDTFYGERPLSVVTTESRAQVVQARSFGEKGEDEGGGGGADFGGIEMRGNFKSTAYWNAFLRTDSSGSLSFRFKLPDNLTRFVIMAVAQTRSSEFGYGENSFTVSKPLLLQASLPRFARLGDTFEAGVVVHNYTKQKGKVVLRTTTDGVTFQGKEVVEFELDAGASKELRHPMSVSRVGKGTFNFQARMGEENDGLSVSIPFDVPRRKEAVAEYKAVTTSTDLQVKIPQDIHERLGSLDVTAASTALSGLESSVEYLFTYPYGCLEQKGSAILPIIVGREMVEAFNLQALRGANLKRIVETTLRELRRYQIYSGGFVYWPGDYRESPYASAYVMHILALAKANGYDVDAAMTKKGTEYLQEMLRWEDKMPEYPYESATWSSAKTLALYTLALLGAPEPGYYEMYFKKLGNIPLFARANLLRAVALSTKNRKMMQTISQNLLNSVKINPTSAHFEEPKMKGLEWCWSSDVRTTALSLHALIEADALSQGSDLHAKILRWLLQQQHAGRWSNTQENAYVVQALSAYFKKYEADVPQFKAELVLAGEQLMQKDYEGRSLNVDRISRPLEKLQRGVSLPLQLNKDGTGTLYAGVRMTYFPKSPAVPAEEGIAITKSMELLQPVEGRKSGVFPAGSLVKVTIRVITPQTRNFVAVEDPLPAGLEAVNTSLVTESSELGRMLAAINQQESEERWWGSFNYKEFRDDRVLLFADQLNAGVHTFTYLARAKTPGKFLLPPAHAEMMYEPEVFGRTGSGEVEIR